MRARLVRTESLSGREYCASYDVSHLLLKLNGTPYEYLVSQELIAPRKTAYGGAQIGLLLFCYDTIPWTRAEELIGELCI